MAGSRSGSAALLLLVALLCGTCVQGAQQRSSHGSSSRSSQQQQQQQHIPRIIHRNYMGGVAALQAATAGPQPDFKAHWLGSCTTHHPGWQEVVWDEAAVLDLIQSDFPWFLRTYLSYPRLVQRSDVMRYMVLYKYGGVYLDADVECFTSMEASLEGRHLVLNCEDPGPWGQLHNAAMASTPGHPFWLSVLQEAMRRAPAAAAAHSSWLSSQLRKLWQRSPFHDGIVDVLQSTGPMLLTDMYQSFTGGAPACGYTATNSNGTVSTAYPVGAWFTPCLCGDDECAWHWTVQHFSLVAAQAEHGSVQVPASKWLKNKTQHQQRKQRHQQHQWERKHQQQQHQQQQQPNQQQQQYSGSVHVHQLSAEERPVVGIHHYSASWTGWDQSHRLVKLQQLKAEMSDHVMHYLAHSAGFLQHTPSSTHADADAAAGAGADAEQEAWAGLLQGDTAKASGSCTVVAVLDQQQQQQQASSSSSFTSAAAAASAVDSPAPDCSPNHHHRGSSCPSSNHADAQECTSRCPTTTGTQHAAANNRSTGAISSHQQTCNAPVASPAAAPIAQQSAELHDDKQLALLQQQGCNIVLVTRDAQPPRLAQDANLLRPAAGAAADTAAGSVRHLQGVRGRRGADGDGTAGVLMLPAALLQRLQDSSNTTRLLLRLSCKGCEAGVLQQLGAAAAAGSKGSSSLLDSLHALVVDLHVPAGLTNSSQGAPSDSNRSGSGSSSGTMAVPCLDDLFNLLHQQLGFRGAWRQQLAGSSNNTLRVAWVRQQSVRDSARMQPPDSASAAAVLRAASASTPPVQLVTAVCDCCSTCCSVSAIRGWLGHGCPLWQRAACRFSELKSSSTAACPPVLVQGGSRQPAQNSQGSDGGGGGDGGMRDASRSSQRCAACCACSQSLWGVLQHWTQSVVVDSTSIFSAVTAGVVGVVTVVLVRARCKHILEQRAARAKEALLL